MLHIYYNSLIMNNLDFKKIRKELKLSQVELANKLGFSRKTISQYENSEVIPDLNTTYTGNPFFVSFWDFIILILAFIFFTVVFYCNFTHFYPKKQINTTFKTALKQSNPTITSEVAM